VKCNSGPGNPAPNGNILRESAVTIDRERFMQLLGNLTMPDKLDAEFDREKEVVCPCGCGRAAKVKYGLEEIHRYLAQSYAGNYEMYLMSQAVGPVGEATANVLYGNHTLILVALENVAMLKREVEKLRSELEKKGGPTRGTNSDTVG
jgi:hypothetical protein